MLGLEFMNAMSNNYNDRHRNHVLPTLHRHFQNLGSIAFRTFAYIVDRADDERVGMGGLAPYGIGRDPVGRRRFNGIEKSP